VTTQREALSGYLDALLKRSEERIARAHARVEAEEAKIRERRAATSPEPQVTADLLGGAQVFRAGLDLVADPEPEPEPEAGL
jgi:hypothetical protein